MGGNYLITLEGSGVDPLEIKLFNRTAYQANKAFVSLASVMTCGIYEHMELVAVGSSKLPLDIRYKKINSAELHPVDGVKIDF